MKYESELLHELLESRGHQKSSLHYESECKEAFIKEAEGAYPKLCDYEAEWLNYIAENPTGNFPYVTFSGTEGTVENVVPYAYKSAILKGNTLVNATKYIRDANRYGLTNHAKFFSSDMLTPYTKYLCIWDAPSYISHMRLYTLGGNTSKYFDATNQKSKKFIITSKESFDGDGSFCPHWYTNGDDVVSKDDLNKFSLMLIPYQDGMENWDIPYFEGMKSVRMPVLTTTGKNLFDGKWIKGKMITDNGSIIDNNETQCSESFIRVSKGNYISSNNGTNRKVNVFKYDLDRNFIGRLGGVDSTFTVDDECLIRFSIGVNNTDYYQFEQGTVATTYEPYKTNILTVNDPIELRGIGDVQDTLDCLTGEVTERIGENVLDDSAEISTSSLNSILINTMIFGIAIPGIKKVQTAQINDKFPSINTNDNDNNDYEHSYVSPSSEKIWFFIDKSKLTENSVNGVKQWLSQNPITVQYQLATESIKTVDLTITNQNGETLDKIKPIEGTMHITTEGNPIKPSIEAEIPVEAITQNLNSFIGE